MSSSCSTCTQNWLSPPDGGVPKLADVVNGVPTYPLTAPTGCTLYRVRKYSGMLPAVTFPVALLWAESTIGTNRTRSGETDTVASAVRPVRGNTSSSGNGSGTTPVGSRTT